MVPFQGKAGLKWQGFNVPIILEDGSEAGKRRSTEDDDKYKKGFGKRWHQKGWSGTSWPGRKVGHPESPDGGRLFCVHCKEPL